MILQAGTATVRHLLIALLVAGGTLIGTATAISAEETAPQAPTLEWEIDELQAVISIDPDASRRSPVFRRTLADRYPGNALAYHVRFVR